MKPTRQLVQQYLKFYPEISKYVDIDEIFLENDESSSGEWIDVYFPLKYGYGNFINFESLKHIADVMSLTSVWKVCSFGLTNKYEDDVHFLVSLKY